MRFVGWSWSELLAGFAGLLLWREEEVISVRQVEFVRERTRIEVGLCALKAVEVAELHKLGALAIRERAIHLGEGRGIKPGHGAVEFPVTASQGDDFLTIRGCTG